MENLSRYERDSELFASVRERWDLRFLTYAKAKWEGDKQEKGLVESDDPSLLDQSLRNYFSQQTLQMESAWQVIFHEKVI